jgi:hypothetical protein
MLFVSKYPKVEAMLFIELSKQDVFNWMDCPKEPVLVKGKPAIQFVTKDYGPTVAMLGEWIVKEEPGSYLVYKDEILKHFFVPVSETSKVGVKFFIPRTWEMNFSFLCSCGKKLYSHKLIDIVECPKCHIKHSIQTNFLELK